MVGMLNCYDKQGNMILVNTQEHLKHRHDLFIFMSSNFGLRSAPLQQGAAGTGAGAHLSEAQDSLPCRGAAPN